MKRRRREWISEKSLKKRWVVLSSSCIVWEGDHFLVRYFVFCVVRRILLASSFSVLFFFFSPKPGLCGGDTSLLFSVAKKGLREVSAQSTGLVGDREMKEERRDVRGKWKRKDRRYSKVKVITEPDPLQSITAQRTGDGITSLKIQRGRHKEVLIVHS